MTVYIIQQPPSNKHGWSPDFSSAEKYGAFKFVFDSYEKVWSIPNPSMKKAVEALKDFNYETDYILWPNIGDPQAMVAFMFAFCQSHQGLIPYCHTLQWDRKRDEFGNRDSKIGFYVPIKWNFRNNIPQKEESDHGY